MSLGYKIVKLKLMLCHQCVNACEWFKLQVKQVEGVRRPFYHKCANGLNLTVKRALKGDELRPKDRPVYRLRILFSRKVPAQAVHTSPASHAGKQERNN